ncbi:MAG: TetR family transcriptional regulator [Rhodospirillales bacterium]|jgi:TetR/AcrR family transcriptional regulator|nr:TetR family transcriptional regulator [Rhodospirillales bacterium]
MTMTPKSSSTSSRKSKAPQGTRASTRRVVHEKPAPTPARHTKRRDAVATRAKILEAAMEEFAAKGLEARIEDIAEIAGANRRMAYYYFGSKEGLYLAALEATYLELVDVEQAIDVDKLGPLEAIAGLVSAKFEHYIKYPRYIEFLKIENLYHARYLKSSQRIKELRGPLISVIGRVLERGQALGVLRQDVDPLELYISICALGYFVFSNQYTLGAIFDVNLTTPRALARRRQIIIDMVTSYLRVPAQGDTDASNKPLRDLRRAHKANPVKLSEIPKRARTRR